MGKVRDMKQRKTLARIDDETRRGKVDLARDIIYNRHYVVNSTAVENILKAQSWVPTDVSASLITSELVANFQMQNVFSRKLAPFGFNPYQILVVDFMHEFELGVWKALFIHLLRILEAYDKTLLVELDRRYMINILADLMTRLMLCLKI
jgi:hypothetical protein